MITGSLSSAQREPAAEANIFVDGRSPREDLWTGTQFCGNSCRPGQSVLWTPVPAAAGTWSTQFPPPPHSLIHLCGERIQDTQLSDPTPPSLVKMNVSLERSVQILIHYLH